MTAFLNPLVNSYERLGRQEAPRYISWSHQNRSQLIRIPASSGESNRMELRSPDPACNPYLAFALLLHAGLDGIEKGEKLPEPCNLNLYEPGVAQSLGIEKHCRTAWSRRSGQPRRANDLEEPSRKCAGAVLRPEERECARISGAADSFEEQLRMYFNVI